jgi:hypothetical protein
LRAELNSPFERGSSRLCAYDRFWLNSALLPTLTKAQGPEAVVKVTLGLTGYFRTLRRIFEKRGPLKWLAFAACLVVFGFGAFTASLEDADRLLVERALSRIASFSAPLWPHSNTISESQGAVKHTLDVYLQSE